MIAVVDNGDHLLLSINGVDCKLSVAEATKVLLFLGHAINSRMDEYRTVIDVKDGMYVRVP